MSTVLSIVEAVSCSSLCCALKHNETHAATAVLEQEVSTAVALVHERVVFSPMLTLIVPIQFRCGSGGCTER